MSLAIRGIGIPPGGVTVTVASQIGAPFSSSETVIASVPTAVHCFIMSIEDEQPTSIVGTRTRTSATRNIP